MVHSMSTIEQITGITLGDRMRRARLRAGIKSHGEMAGLLHAHRNSVGAYEADKTTPPLDVAARWAEITGHSLEWLATGRGEPFDPEASRAEAITERERAGPGQSTFSWLPVAS